MADLVRDREPLSDATVGRIDTDDGMLAISVEDSRYVILSLKGLER